jgi:membrane protease YdiL (CAAX protease family)
MIIVRREEGDLRWATIKRRLRLNTPRDPATGVPRARLWLWVVPFLVAVVVFEGVLTSPIQNAWVSVFPFFAEPQGYSFDAIFESQEILEQLVGAWWFFALFVIYAVFNTILGEEFLFRGVLLPRMEGVFGRGSWVANSVLFGFYHVHQPWGILDSILSGLLYTFPAYRYRSTWMPNHPPLSTECVLCLPGAWGRFGVGLELAPIGGQLSHGVVLRVRERSLDDRASDAVSPSHHHVGSAHTPLSSKSDLYPA